MPAGLDLVDDNKKSQGALRGYEGVARFRPMEGTGKTTKNRNMAAAATTYAETTNTVTWTAADNVTEIVIASVGGTSAPLLNDMALIIYDGLNEAADLAAFADAGGLAADVDYELVSLTQPIRRAFPSYLGRVSVLPLGGATTRFVIQAQ